MYRVTERADELSDTVTISLVPTAEPIDTPRPGQFTMLWAFGIGEAPISIAGVSDDGITLTHTIRAVGAVTKALCGLELGEEVGVRGPFGSSWPIENAVGQDVLVAAGGLGLSPVRPIIHQVLAERERFRNLTLLIGARRPEALYYLHELRSFAVDDRIQLEFIVDAADETWTGNVGLITKLIANEELDRDRTHAFLCGPEPMMRLGALGIIDHGVPAENVWVSLERNMHCAIAQCGHCQLGPLFICREGPVVSWPTVDDLLRIPER